MRNLTIFPRTKITPMRVRLRKLGRAAFWLGAFSLGYVGTMAWAAETHEIYQRNRAFNIKTLSIAAGDLVKFNNSDEFIHQIFVESAKFNFDSAESEPGNVIDLKFTVPGTFEVHCHIHPKMKRVVRVN